MSRCCPHSDEEHHVVGTCIEVVHYPSEDYPCVCHAFEPPAEGDRCAGCGHPQRSHGRVRVCRPAGGEVCGCQQNV